MKKYVIIVAGGSGTRMGAEIPKQFLEINDKPILAHTMEAFYRFDNQIEFIVVLPLAHIQTWKKLREEVSFVIEHEVVVGGQTRYHSVKNGLMKVPVGENLVAVHDAVRPLVSDSVVRNCFLNAERFGAVVPVVPLKDSIRKVEVNGGSEAVSREGYRLVQTPQVFLADVLKQAYAEVEFSDQITDDASVVESNGGIVHLVDGDYQNIKITTPDDLLLASMYMNK